MNYFFYLTAIILLNFHSAVVASDWTLELVNKYQISAENKDLGGLSALHIENFGKSFLVLSDKGKFFKAEAFRNSNGELENVQFTESGSLKSSKGKALTGRDIDSESIAVIKPEGYYISFESNSRIMLHDDIYSSGKFLPKHPDFERLGYNKGIESLAVDALGALHAIPEKPPRGEDRYPIYKLVEGKWQIFTRFFPSNALLVSDATFLPDNSLLLLERGYNWSSGFITQLRQLEFKGKRTVSEKILLRIASGIHNYEGISLWQDRHGLYFISLISDNNFLPAVSTELIEFKLSQSK
ncbi:MAG: esterase-like activity of phytase family protein [Pseudomonadota bacterium]|nr:esterase-like activity of phytase family protein [Pseudomonadota bacterium]